MWYAVFFSYSVGCLVTLLMMFFDAQKLLILMKSIYHFFIFWSCLWCRIQKIIVIQYHEGFLLCFLLRVFVLLALMFKSLICFELNFIYGVKVIVQLHFSHVNTKFSQHLLLKRLCFPHWMISAGFSKIIWPYMGWFISGLSLLFSWSTYLYASTTLWLD